MFELEGTQESGSHIGWELVRCREERRCKEWMRREAAGHHRGLAFGQDGELTRALA